MPRKICLATFYPTARHLFYVGALVLGFLRDYTTGSSSIIELVFTLLLVELASDAFVRPLSMRMINKSPDIAAYFDKDIIVVTAIVFLVISLILIVLINEAEIDIVDGYLLALTLSANIIYRYASNQLLSHKRYVSFYALDFVKACLIFSGFLLELHSIIACGYLLVSVVSMTMAFRLANPRRKKLLRRVSIIAAVYRKDISLQVHIVLSAVAMGFDKTILDAHGEEVLLFTLINKFILFSSSFFGNLHLQITQIELRESRKAANFLSIAARGVHLMMFLISFYLSLFLYIIWFLPVGVSIPPDNILVFVGGLWLLSILIRDISARLMYINNKNPTVGYVMSIALLAYLAVVAFSPYKDPAFFVSVAAAINVATAFCFSQYLTRAMSR